MHSKTGQIVSIILFLGLILFWSASILAAEPAAESTTEAERTSVRIANDAALAAADDAVSRIVADARSDLDIRLAGHTSEQVAAN